MPALTQRESPFAVLALAEAGMIGILIAAASLVLVTGAAGAEMRFLTPTTWRRLRTASCGSVASSRGLRDVSIRRPATSRKFHLAAAP